MPSPTLTKTRPTQMTTTAAASRGFSLIELLAVLSVLAALLLIAAPGYREFILNNRMVSEVYALRATLANARSEALARRAPVVVCPTADGASCVNTTNWTTGYVSFVDTDNDRALDAGEEVIQWEARGVEATVQFDNPTNNLVQFDPRGYSLNFEGTFTFCDPRGVTEARALILTPAGALRAATDTDSPEDEIVNKPDPAGTNIINVGC